MLELKIRDLSEKKQELTEEKDTLLDYITEIKGKMSAAEENIANFDQSDKEQKDSIA